MRDLVEISMVQLLQVKHLHGRHRCHLIPLEITSGDHYPYFSPASCCLLLSCSLSHYHVVSLHVGPLAHDLITKAPRGTAVFILSPKNWWKMLTRRVSAQHKSREVEVKMLSSDPFQTSSPFNYVIFLLAMENSSVAIETNRAQGLV